ncbi:MAG: hypothetical protein F6K00_33640 [Leptolyngbya sp. SIOISBB]|nr:hypothetical protein [Leptolyngbya sp. SIOISBB]
MSTDIDNATGVTTQDADKAAQATGGTVGVALSAAAMWRFRDDGQADVPLTIQVGEETLRTSQYGLSSSIKEYPDEAKQVAQRALSNESLPSDPETKIAINRQLVFHQTPNYYKDGSPKRFVHPDFDPSEFKALFNSAPTAQAGEHTESERDDGAVLETSVSPLGASVSRVDQKVLDQDVDEAQSQAKAIGAQVCAYAPNKRLSVAVGETQLEADSGQLSEVLTTELDPAEITLLHQSVLEGQRHDTEIAIHDIEADRTLYFANSQTRLNTLASPEENELQRQVWHGGSEETLTTEVVPLSVAEAMAGQNEGDVSTDSAAIWMAQPTTATVTKDARGRIIRAPTMEGLEATVDKVERRQQQAQWAAERLEQQGGGNESLATMLDQCVITCYGEQGQSTIFGNRYNISRDGQGGLSVEAKDGRGVIFERDPSGEIKSSLTAMDVQNLGKAQKVLDRHPSLPALTPQSPSPATMSSRGRGGPEIE